MVDVPEFPGREHWGDLVAAALAEDLGSGDATSEAIFPAAQTGRVRLEARTDLVLSGSPLAADVFARCGAEYESHAADANAGGPKQVVGYARGRVIGLLAAERTALNFMQRLSGIATQTARYVAAVAGTRADIVDTRKTTPGWRALEKYAVRCGGGVNHRLGLYDAILVKDNHIAAAGGVAAAVQRVRERAAPGLLLQVEVESLDAAQAAVDGKADSILIDNQSPESIREFVERFSGVVTLEASGGVTFETVRAIAETGVDRISIGALTHSATASDLAIEWEA